MEVLIAYGDWKQVTTKGQFIEQEGNGPIDFGRQGPWKIKVQILVASTSLAVTSDLKIELSDLNYPGIHVHIASNSHFGGL